MPNRLFRTSAFFPLPAWGIFLLSTAGHAGDPRVHHSASTGTGRGPWGVLWAFKAANSGKKPREDVRTLNDLALPRGRLSCDCFTSKKIVMIRYSPRHEGNTQHAPRKTCRAAVFLMHCDYLIMPRCMQLSVGCSYSSCMIRSSEKT